ncbi:ImmA/IrrE family metallo-endopeptidase [Microbacterium sp. gxy059]|uniref:ImmA/IrrE family metallo-endopeptidase n=1 Tax=Microbacterium sp. gxy059 TaxID=2957199 RepID=UPI003D9826E0
MSTAEATARDVLDSLYGEGVRPLPIDPVQVARALGVNVFGADFENSLSGMIAKLEAGGDVEIFVNTTHAPVRQRFTTAHELGHYFSEKSKGEDRPYVHRRDALSACGTAGEEIFANQFAAELLMPAAEVRRLHALGFSRVDLANRFQVSLDALGHRLANLGLS